MSRLASAVVPVSDPAAAAALLAARIEGALGGPECVAGGFVFATAAAGRSGAEVGRALAGHWPAAELLGTSFEGIIGEGRAFLGEPAVALLAWSAGPEAPTPIVLAGEGRGPEEWLAELVEIFEALARGEHDLALVFPDADGGGLLEGLLAPTPTVTAPASAPDSADGRRARSDRGEFGPAWGSSGPEVVGAIATGVDGSRSRPWSLRPDEAGASESGSGEEPVLVGIWFPGGAGRRAGRPPRRARVVGATRRASPWLEITACRPHWIDALEGEPPTVWIRRQLGLSDSAPLEPLLDRLLIRVARTEIPSNDEDFHECDPVRYEERYAAGLDLRRGALGWLGRFARFDRLAFALSDPAWAREGLRTAIAALPSARLLFQISCPSRGEALHGDRDLESALVASELVGIRGQSLGVIAPNQLLAAPGEAPRLLVHSTVLAALGEVLRDSPSD